MLESSLLPLSLKESHQKLSGLAAYIFNLGTRKVQLCHILKDDAGKKREDAELKLDVVAEIFRDHGFQPDKVTGTGPIASEVCRMAGKYRPDYICIPWKPKNVIRRVILSSPDMDILRICSYPTLIYKTTILIKTGENPDTLLYATELKKSDNKVLPCLKSEFPDAGRLHLLHVRERAPDPVTDKKHIRQVQEKMESMSGKCRNHFDSVETHVVTGSVRTAIARKARNLDADLIIIGRNEKEKPLEKILGSTAESLPHKVGCPVLIIV